MIKRTLYFGNPAYLSMKNSQLVIRLPEIEKSTITDKMKSESQITFPIEDLGIIVLDNGQITITEALIERLLENNVVLISCSKSHMPNGMMLPMQKNTTLTERWRYHLEASLPLKKQLWQQTIQQKIHNQAILLSNETDTVVKNMLQWEKEVKSGDSDNVEARAAAYYWKNIFPNVKDFRRDAEGGYPNMLLNYGYAILRAIIARALVASGLIVQLGIHHRNKYNPYCLADDIMEPYRPYVDKAVCDIMQVEDPCDEITTRHKQELLSIPVMDVWIDGKMRPLEIAASITTASLFKCFSGEARKIIYPEMQ